MLGPCLLTFMYRLALFRHVFKGKKEWVGGEQELEGSSVDPLQISGDSFHQSFAGYCNKSTLSLKGDNI